MDNELLVMRDFSSDLFMENHFGHGTVGVVHNRQHEHYGNYVRSILPLRYDAL